MSTDYPETTNNAPAGPSSENEKEHHEGAPSYDLSKENYAGISSAGPESLEDLRAARDFAEMIVDTVREGLLVLDFDLRVQAANESFYQIFEVRPEETLGQLVYELGGGQWNIPKLHELLEGILPEKKVFNDFEVEHDFPGIGRRVMLLNARQLNDHQLILLALEDATERRKSVRVLRELASRLTMAEQQERRRVSQILHDDLQQMLYGIRMKADFLRKDAASGDREALSEEAAKLYDLLGSAIETTKQLTVDLSPPVLQGEGLVDALAWLRVHVKELYGMEIELEAEHAFYIPDEDVRVLLFQIVRELLFNVTKHAGTDHATVSLHEEDGHLVIEVVDWGRGFDVAAADGDREGGFGLFSVRERLSLFDGRMEIDSAPGEGTRVVIHAPVAPKRLDIPKSTPEAEESRRGTR